MQARPLPNASASLLCSGSGWARHIEAHSPRGTVRIREHGRHPLPPSYRGRTQISRTIRAAAAGQGPPDLQRLPAAALRFLPAPHSASAGAGASVPPTRPPRASAFGHGRRSMTCGRRAFRQLYTDMAHTLPPSPHGLNVASSLPRQVCAYFSSGLPQSFHDEEQRPPDVLWHIVLDRCFGWARRCPRSCAPIDICWVHTVQARKDARRPIKPALRLYRPGTSSYASRLVCRQPA